VIEEGAKLDNQIQIGHNVRIGAHTAMAACSGVSGSTVIGKRCMIGGACGFSGHITVADDVVITGFTMVSRSVKKSGIYSGGIPFEEARIWRKLVGRFKRLQSVTDRLDALELALGKAPRTQQEEDDV
jgi:UDP-3-O-[3-hydroxymyristoyl] glucosamine N-acyltransferase